MDEKYERGILRLSAVFILGGVLLIPLGFVGVAANFGIVVGMVVLAGVLFYAWKNTDEYDTYLSGLWLGPAIAAIVALIGVLMGASAGELQALGGMTGLLGVINLLLRPVYRIAHYILFGAIQIGREIQEEGW